MVPLGPCPRSSGSSDLAPIPIFIWCPSQEDDSGSSSGRNPGAHRPQTRRWRGTEIPQETHRNSSEPGLSRSARKDPHHNLVCHSEHDFRIGLDCLRRGAAGSLELLAWIPILLLHCRLRRNHSGNTSTSGSIGAQLTLHAGVVRSTAPHRPFPARRLPRTSMLSIPERERSDRAHAPAGWEEWVPDPTILTFLAFWLPVLPRLTPS